MKAAVDTLEDLTELVADKDTTIRHLRRLLLPASAEKTKDVLAKVGAAAANPAWDSKSCLYWGTPYLRKILSWCRAVGMPGRS